MNKIKSITSAALFAAIHVIFTLLGRFVPGTELILVIFLPLASAIYVLRNNNIGTLAFGVSTLLLCALTDIFIACIYVLPALIVGITYGILVKKKTSQDVAIIVTILAELVSLVISVLVIKLLYIEYDLLDTIQDFLKLTDHQMLYFLPSIAFVVALTQAIAVHATLKSELKKLKYEFRPFEHFSKIFYFGLPLFLVLGIGLSFCYIPASIICCILANAFAVPVIIEGYRVTNNSKNLLYILAGVQCVLLIGAIFPLLNVLPNLYLGYLPLILFFPILLTSFIKTF